MVVLDSENEIQRIADLILDENPESIIQFKLLKEVIRVGNNEIDEELLLAIEQNKWVQLLQEEQWSDGSWGRLHSKDTSKKQKIPTTEMGVRKARLLGLEKNHPIIDRVLMYLNKNISKGICRDPPEKNNRWPIGVKLWFASSIALIDPNQESISSVVDSWVQVLNNTFESGNYNGKHEKDAYKDIFGLTDEIRYLHLNSKYHLELFSWSKKKISKGIIDAYTNWLWEETREIYYMPINLANYRIFHSRYLYSWLNALKYVLKFGYHNKTTSLAIDWVWNQRNEQGLWDFGPVTDNYYKLSSNWRKNNRSFDCSTLVLCVLKDYYNPQFAM